MAQRRIVGIPTATGASCLPPATEWSMFAILQPWRIEGEAASTSQLRIGRVGSKEQTSAWAKSLSLGGPVILSVVLEGDAARFVSYEGPAVDAELTSLSADARTRPALQDTRFGTFAYQSALDNYEVKAKWNGNQIDLSIQAEDHERARHEAGLLWDEQALWQNRLEAALTAELQPLKNEGWLEEGEAPLSGDQLIERVRLEAIEVNADGNFSFFFDDGELFGGHTIVIDACHEQGVEEVYLAG